MLSSRVATAPVGVTMTPKGWWTIGLFGCVGGTPTQQVGPADVVSVEVGELLGGQGGGQEVPTLTPAEKLLRISMALRGIRPSVEDLTAVTADPSTLPDFVDTYLNDPLFGATVRSLHAEAFLTRSTETMFPSVGPIAGISLEEIRTSMQESPLKLVEQVVMQERPYTEIVTANYTMADANSAEIWGLAYDEQGEEWQESYYFDSRPHVGVLSDSNLFTRWLSDGSNHQRGRANMISRALLCEDFLTRDIPLSGTVDLSDDEAVAEAVNTLPECVGCHQALDPLGAHLWGFRRKINFFTVFAAYQADCAGNLGAFCYPIDGYTASSEGLWDAYGLRRPAYFGLASDDLESLGQNIADDPRFAQCAARRFAGYFTQTDPEDVPFDVAAELQLEFVANGFDAKALAKSVVLSDEFLAATDGESAVPGLQVIRPEQTTVMIEDLTGFKWITEQDQSTCGTGEFPCWGDFDLAQEDRYGFRAMAGGIDSFRVTRPVHTMMPIRALFQSAIAQEAAGFVVQNDFQISDPADRKLLKVMLTSSDLDDARVNQQITALHQRIYGEVSPVEAEVDETRALFDAALAANSGNVATAWKVTLSAMLQDVKVLYY